ncbi:MAG: hypothetical protein WCB31_08890 [Nitrososphaeraceae archaeon]
MQRSLDSREFKLILKPEIFRSLNKGIRKIQKIFDSKVDTLNGKFKPDPDIKPNFRRTYYLDTVNYKLRSKNFFLRVREDKESKKYTITLKCRHPDRYISAAYDLSGPTNHKVKFEEDIIAPHVSKFSISAEFNDDREPEINNLEDLRKIFPGLRKYDLGEGRLEKVNKFEAKEISVELGKISYSDKNGKGNYNEIKTYLNFWYLPKKKRIPLIVEFTYDYSAINKKEEEKNKNNKMKISIEEFPLFLVRNTYEFYSSLQDTKVVDLKSSKTKTEFAYQYKS